MKWQHAFGIFIYVCAYNAPLALGIRFIFAKKVIQLLVAANKRFLETQTSDVNYLGFGIFKREVADQKR